jgi:hypothetical protein
MPANIDDLYQRISRAETGGEKNPYIRTRVAPKEGSTAFGPVQITGNLVRGHLSPGNVSRFSPEEQAFLRRMDAQAQKFAKFGREPRRPGYHPRYDYGGSGDLIQTDADKRAYELVAKKMLAYELEQAKGDPVKAVERWRGKARSADPKYFSKIFDRL